MDRFRARSLSGRTYLHLLGLFPSALAEEFGIAYRSSFAQRRTGATTPQGRRRSLGPRPAPRKRPRADLDRVGYGREERKERNGPSRSLSRYSFPKGRARKPRSVP